MVGCLWGFALVASSMVYACFGNAIEVDHQAVAYKEIGDLNIGGLFSVSQLTGGKFCKIIPTTEFFSVLQYMELLAHTVRLVNQNHSLLPGIKLGFVFLDACSNVQSTMVQAKRFLPRSSPMDYIATNETNVLPSYSVVGVLVAPKNDAVVSISILYGGVGIPVIGFMDVIAVNKEQNWHPTFIQVSPSSDVIFKAMVRFMKLNNFTYFSAALQNGRNADLLSDRIIEESTIYNICVSKVLLLTRHSDFDLTYRVLTENRVKVVVAFLNSEAAELLLTAAEKRGTQFAVIWIVTASWMHLLKSGRLHKNAFLFSSSPVELNRALYNLESIDSNPWYRLALSSPLCIELKCVPNQLKHGFLKADHNKGEMRDAVITFAHGLHNLITDKCPGVKGSNATTCFNKHAVQFINYLKNVRFQGVSGEVLFDTKRVKDTDLNIYQEISLDGNSNHVIRVAKYHVTKDLLHDVKSLHSDIILFAINEARREAYCQIPCNVSEHKNYVGCCWVCRACQNNEIVTDNKTACGKCPPLQWPAMQSGQLSICKDILPDYFDWFDPAHIVFLVVAATCAVRTVYLLLQMILNTNVSVIPLLAHSVALKVYTYCQIVAIQLELVSVPIFLYRPSVPQCYIAQILFVFSFILEYTIILLRLVYIYQKCFESDADKNSSCIRKWSYCIAVYLLWILQMIICILLVLFYPIRKIKQQPMVGENFVEEFCDLPVPLAVAFLVSVFTLLMLCAVVSLKTQDHEFGKNLGRFAPTYIYESLVMWVVFMPAYFTAFRGGMRIYYQVIAVLLNATVSLILNFTPSFMLSLCTGKRDSFTPQWGGHPPGQTSMRGASLRSSFLATLRGGSFSLRSSGVAERNTRVVPFRGINHVET